VRINKWMDGWITADFETHYRDNTVASLPITAILPHHFLNLFPFPWVLPR